MKFTYAAIVLAATATSVMAAPIPSAADSSISARGLFDSILHTVKSVVEPIAQPVESILGIGGGQQKNAPANPSEQLFRIDENGNAVPVAMEQQVEQDSSGPLGGLLNGLTNGLTNVVGNVASDIGGLIGGEQGAATAGSIVSEIGSVAGEIAPIAAEVAPIAEEVAPLALAAIKG